MATEMVVVDKGEDQEEPQAPSCSNCGETFSRAQLMADYWQELDEFTSRLCELCRGDYPVPDPILPGQFWDKGLSKYIKVEDNE